MPAAGECLGPVKASATGLGLLPRAPSDARSSPSCGVYLSAAEALSTGRWPGVQVNRQATTD